MQGQPTAARTGEGAKPGAEMGIPEAQRPFVNVDAARLEAATIICDLARDMLGREENERFGTRRIRRTFIRQFGVQMRRLN
jgi:hypothetical protein